MYQNNETYKRFFEPVISDTLEINIHVTVYVVWLVKYELCCDVSMTLSDVTQR